MISRVGSYLTQSVYSVATPFHPFGGAVDIIVVQQQDGSFRSTPWYVRFGKFQGVLKGAEKIVKIEVNGVEADFHMFLDNSGEAYFIKEVDKEVTPEKDSDIKDDFALEKNNNVEAQFQENHADGTQSDGENDLDGSIELSDFGSNRFDNIENDLESNSSEVVLFSVDGQILSAPITSTEENTENVQLSTPQFHLGPIEGPEFEGGLDLSNESTWAQYLSDISRQKEKGDENQSIVSLERELSIRSVVEDSPSDVKEDVFKSCLALNDLGKQENESEGVENVESSKLEVKRDEGVENAESTKLEVRSDDGVENVESSKLEVEHHEGVENVESTKLEVKLDEGVENVESTKLEVKRVEGVEITESTKLEVEHVEGVENVKSSKVEVKRVEGVENVESTKLEVKRDEGVENVESSKLEVEHHEGVENVESTKLEVKRDEGVENVESSKLEVKRVEGAERVESTKLEVKRVVGVENVKSTKLEVKSDERVKSDESVKLEVETESTGLNSQDTKLKVSDVKVVKDQDGEEFERGESSPYGPEIEDACTASVTEEPQSIYDDNENFDGLRRSRIEISLCGNLLRPGMGSSTASETFNAHRIPEEEFKTSAASIIKNDSLIVKIEEKYFTWDKVAHIVLGMAAYGLEMPVEPKDAIPVDWSGPGENGLASTPSGRRWRLWPIPFRRVKTLDHSNSNISGEDVFLDSESVFDSPQSVEATPTSSQSPRKQFVRTQVPSTEQISSLNLKDGQNMVSFIFSTRVLGVQKVDAHIYLWKWNARIVISDVDGTITKSDVLGQFMPLVGKDWTQSGVAHLFSAIKENGYQLLFLSARAIVQAYLTRSFLNNLKQDGKALPNGPVVISPDGLFPSLYREVIRRAPHEFKIACLEDIKALFPSDYNPFYAGFGNRDTDELSYRKIGIPKGKIFIINPKGEVAISHRVDMKGKSYTSLHTLVNDMFPPTSMVEQEDYNSWNYWRMPLPDVDL